jgi:hypothetical protein
MDEEQRDRARHNASLMHKVDVERAEPGHVHREREHRERVDLRLPRTPIVAVFPARHKALHERQLRAVRAPCTRQRVRDASESQASL